jgi:hypothetical protein
MMKQSISNSMQALLGASLMFVSVHVLFAQTSLDTSLSSGENTITKTATTSTDTAMTDTNGTISSGVVFIDIIPPVLKIVGGDVLYVKMGTAYIDPGAQAYDNSDGDISSYIITENNVNTGVPGVYYVVYRVQDRAGNKAQAERTVYVVAPDANTTISSSTPTTESVSVGSTTTNETDTSSQDRDLIQVQTDNLLKIIQENNTQKIEAEKQRIIKNASEDSAKHFASSTKESLIDNAKASQPVQESPEVVQEKIQKVLERAQTTTDETRIDSDHDGISDYDEKYIYGTDPHNPDTDGDGYSDGSEILGGFDPKNPDLRGTISYESPKDITVEVKKDILAATSISIVKTKQEEGNPPLEKVEFKGRGLPNSFVTLYIYSVPMVITVRTDSEGNWEYVLDKELADGNHELYVAMTDNAGKVLAKSSPIPFVKEANAITVDQTLLAPAARGRSPDFFTSGWAYAIVTVIISIIGVIFAIVGMRAQPYARRYTGEIDPNDPSDGSNHV